MSSEFKIPEKLKIIRQLCYNLVKSMGAVLYVFMVHSVAIFDLHNLYLID